MSTNTNDNDNDNDHDSSRQGQQPTQTQTAAATPAAPRMTAADRKRMLRLKRQRSNNNNHHLSASTRTNRDDNVNGSVNANTDSVLDSSRGSSSWSKKSGTNSVFSLAKMKRPADHDHPSFFGAVMKRASPSSNAKTETNANTNTYTYSGVQNVKSKSEGIQLEESSSRFGDTLTRNANKSNSNGNSSSSSSNYQHLFSLPTQIKEYAAARANGASDLVLHPHYENSNSNSNSGFAILKVLDNMTNFANINEDENMRVEDTNMFHNGHDSNDSTSLDDWRQTNIILPSHDFPLRPTIGVVDWSLKKSVKIECHPGRCLQKPFVRHFMNSSLHMHWNIKKVAHQLISSNAFLSSDLENDDEYSTQHRLLSSLKSDEDRASALWLSSTLYWQHPSTHPLPSKVLSTHYHNSNKSKNINDEKNRPEVEANGKNHNHQQKNTSSLFSSKGRSASISNGLPSSVSYNHRTRAAGTGCLGGLGSSAEDKVTISTMMNTRRREWADAFRDLYYSWVSKILFMNQQQKRFKLNVDEMKSRWSKQFPIGNLPCFYALSPGRTVLFRCAMASDVQDMVTKKNLRDDDQYIPYILISSSSEDFREELRARGVTIRLTGGKEYNEPTGDDNAVYEKEVEALRRDMSTGEQVGLEVDVKVNDRKKGYPALENSALSIFGESDCHSFYEIFHGSFGSAFIGKKGELFDVPLLLNRSIGPTMYATMKQLLVSDCYDGCNPRKNMSSNDYAYIELRGENLWYHISNFQNLLIAFSTLRLYKFITT